MNIRGQSGLQVSKQLQIEAFLRYNNCDILNLQEVNIDEESFSTCEFIQSNYNILENNSTNKYGTACLVKTDLQTENIRCDSEGRVILFDLGGLTFGNIYLHSGTDARSRAGREKYFCETLPMLLLNTQDTGCVGGDFNCIVDRKDATNYPESKMSKGLQRLISLKGWKDSFRSLYPNTSEFSRYYENSRAEGATRIDRNYHFGEISITESKYLPVAFSDHFSQIIQISLPDQLSRILCPKSRSTFRLRPEVIMDNLFKERLAIEMESWQRIKNFQNDPIDTLLWWDLLIKPGIKRLGIQRSKELNKERREELNLLLLRQVYLVKKIQRGQVDKLGELRTIHLLIESWYNKESQKIQHQSRAKEFQESEKTSIYHHELHKKFVKKSSILQLITDSGLLEGHKACAAFLEGTVEDLLLQPPDLDHDAQLLLLEEVVPVFSDKDNSHFLSPPTEEKVLKVVSKSNLNAAPGTDGLPSLLYKECWEILGKSLTEVVVEVFNGKTPPSTMLNSLMVFGSKPKKLSSILPRDKRKISLLNADFKVITGFEAEKFNDVATHTLSQLQLVAGNNRRIHHGINKARNAIHAASKAGHPGCGILDTDLIAAFDYMCLDWVYKVLIRKGLDIRVINRLRNLYKDNITTVVVNNIEGKKVKNIRLSLRQGDIPSMVLFSYGIDPLLIYLEKRLQGILISSLPVQGPVYPNQAPLAPSEERYKVIGYADDIKPAITNIMEFLLVDKAMELFEKASGCKLHRDPATKKCKFLPLARWRGTLRQEDIPCQYMAISDHLEMVGVELRQTWTQTKKANGDIVQARVSRTIGPWRSGKFMQLNQRGWSINQYCMSKIFFRTHSIELRQLDITKITSNVKTWLYADQLLKPEEIVMYRPITYGGLGVINVKLKATAGLIKSFLETVGNENFIPSLYHTILFRVHVLDDNSIPNPGFPPFYNENFFALIRKVHYETPLNVLKMSERQWYTHLLEDQVIKEIKEDGEEVYKPCRVEVASPTTNWENTWRLARLTGLGPKNVSFLFRLLHHTLPTQERIARIRPGSSSACKAPGCDSNSEETLEHAIFYCDANDGVGTKIMEALHKVQQVLVVEEVLRLELQVDKEDELPVVWFLASTMRILWDTRQSGSRVDTYTIRSQLEAEINLLRKTRLEFLVTKIEDLAASLVQTNL